MGADMHHDKTAEALNGGEKHGLPRTGKKSADPACISAATTATRRSSSAAAVAAAEVAATEVNPPTFLRPRADVLPVAPTHAHAAARNRCPLWRVERLSTVARAAVRGQRAIHLKQERQKERKKGRKRG